uniref:FCP1 homology domain-containing protein n=1 Tax=Syphacia muris TaxID=451379 RepID=A0A0N5AUF6_9BILA
MVTSRTGKNKTANTKNSTSAVSKPGKLKSQVNAEVNSESLNSNSNEKLPEAPETSTQRKRLKCRKAACDDEFVPIEPIRKGKRIRLTERQREKFIEQNENALFFEEGFSQSSSLPLISRLPSEYLVDSQSQSNFVSCKKTDSNSDAANIDNFAVPQLPPAQKSDDLNKVEEEEGKGNKKSVRKKARTRVKRNVTNNSDETEKSIVQSTENLKPSRIQNSHQSDIWLEKSDSEDEPLSVYLKQHSTSEIASDAGVETIVAKGILNDPKVSLGIAEAEVEESKSDVSSTKILQNSQHCAFLGSKGCCESQQCEMDIANGRNECVENVTGENDKKDKFCGTDNASNLSKKVSRKTEVKSKDIRSFLSPRNECAKKVAEVDCENEKAKSFFCETVVEEDGAIESLAPLASQTKQTTLLNHSEPDKCADVKIESMSLPVTGGSEIKTVFFDKVSSNTSPVAKQKRGKKKKVRELYEAEDEAKTVKGPIEIVGLTTMNDEEDQSNLCAKESMLKNADDDVTSVKNTYTNSSKIIYDSLKSSLCAWEKFNLEIVGGAADALNMNKVAIKEKGTSNVLETGDLLGMSGKNDLKVTEKDEKVVNSIKTPEKNILNDDLSQSTGKRTPGILKKSPASTIKTNNTNIENSSQKRVHFDADSKDSSGEGRGNKSEHYTVPLYTQGKRKKHHGALFHNPEEKQTVDPPVIPFSSLEQNGKVKVEKSLLPELVDLKDSLTPKMLTKLSPYEVQALRFALKSRGIKTVGDFAKLPESEISTLPIRSPNVETARDVLCEYAKIPRPSSKKWCDNAFWKASPLVLVEQEFSVESANSDSLKSLNEGVNCKQNSSNQNANTSLSQYIESSKLSAEFKGRNASGSPEMVEVDDSLGCVKVDERVSVSPQKSIIDVKDTVKSLVVKTCQDELKDSCCNLISGENSNAKVKEEVEGPEDADNSCIAELPIETQSQQKSSTLGEIQTDRHGPNLNPSLPEVFEKFKDACIVLKQYKQEVVQSGVEKSKIRNTLCKVIQLCTEHLLDLQD